jgi:hypothetical protein
VFTFRQAAIVAALMSALFSTTAASAVAGDRCCAACGGCDDCEKCCRLVCEEKKVEVVCYGFKCEDFCLPGHSHRSCKHGEMLCDDCQCDPKAPCAKEKKFVWYDWIPGCSEGVCTKRKLHKKTITKKVPTVKWVVEDLCCDCQAKAAQAAAPPPEVKVPAPPAVQAKFIAPRKRP